MASKNKLRRRIKKQRITHLLEVNDIRIELEEYKYRANIAETKIEMLQYENKQLKADMSSILSISEAQDDVCPYQDLELFGEGPY